MPSASCPRSSRWSSGARIFAVASAARNAGEVPGIIPASMRRRLALAPALLLLSACGDDEPPPASAAPPSTQPAPVAAAMDDAWLVDRVFSAAAEGRPEAVAGLNLPQRV